MAGCCCCTVYPVVVVAGIINIVVTSIALIFAIIITVALAGPNANVYWERDQVHLAVLLPLDYVGGLLGLLGSSLLVFHATDRLALVKRPPFCRILTLLTLSMVCSACNMGLSIVEECVTSPSGGWWRPGPCNERWPLAIIRGIVFLFATLTFTCVGIIHRRPPPKVPVPTGCATSCAAAVSSSSSSSAETTADGIALSSGVIGSSSTDAVPNAVGASGLDAELGDLKHVAKTGSGPARRPCCSTPCSQLWKLCAMFWLLCAVLMPTLVYTSLRRECQCYDGQAGPEWTLTRFCYVPHGANQMPPTPSGATDDDFLTFSGCEAFASYLRASSCPRQSYYWFYSRPMWGLARSFGGDDGMVMETMAMDSAVAESAGASEFSTRSTATTTAGSTSGGAGGAAGSPEATPSYSGTNVQVQGVDEADIVKTDGHYLYTLTPSARWSQQATLNIVRTWPVAAAALVSSTELSGVGYYGITPAQLFLDGDALLVIGAQYHEDMYETSDTSDASRRWRYYSGGMSTVRMLLFDVSDRASPRLTRVEEVEGYYVAARKVGSMVYVVSNAEPIYSADRSAGANAAELMPLKRSLLGPTNIAASTRADFVPVDGSCSAVGYVPSVRARSLIVVASLDMQSYTTPMRTTVVTGRGRNIYASSRSLYVASPASWRNGGRTMVVRFALDNGVVTYAGIVPVTGYILSQWAMDEHRASASGAALSGGSGVSFRIVTTTTTSSTAAQTSHLFTYAVDVGSAPGGPAGASSGGDGVGLTPLGSLSGLAPGERVYAVRFMGERLYVVTFRQVDPLFVIDITTPMTPVLLGELKVPGYSDYLHPVNATHLIGIGRDASNEGRLRGMKLALFDASTPTAPAESYNLTLGDRQTTSAALDDHKAFAYDSARRLLTLPVRLYLSDACPCAEAGSYGPGCSSWPDVIWQGAVLWHLGETRFELKGLVPHYDPRSAHDPPEDTPSSWAAAPAVAEGTSTTTSGGSSTTSSSTSTPEPASGGLPMCSRYDLPTCAGAMSTAVARAIYMSNDVLYTLSPSLVRADSLATLANLTRDAVALTTAASPNGAAVSAAWDAAFAGSRLAEVALPHSPCGNGEYGMPISIMPVPLAARIDATSRVADDAPSPPSTTTPCECACTNGGCRLGGAATMRAASALGM